MPVCLPNLSYVETLNEGLSNPHRVAQTISVTNASSIELSSYKLDKV